MFLQTLHTHTHNHIYMLVLFFEGCSAASQDWGLTDAHICFCVCLVDSPPAFLEIIFYYHKMLIIAALHFFLIIDFSITLIN